MFSAHGSEGGAALLPHANPVGCNDVYFASGLDAEAGLGPSGGRVPWWNRTELHGVRVTASFSFPSAEAGAAGTVLFCEAQRVRDAGVVHAGPRDGWRVQKTAVLLPLLPGIFHPRL